MSEPFDLHEAAFEAVHRWWKAWVERDPHVLQQMAAADYMERNGMGQIQTLGSGRLVEILSREGDTCSITEWKLWDPVTRVFKHVVVCSYMFRFSGRRGKRSFAYEGRATDVLSRKDDQWCLVSHEGVLEGSRLII